jgi:hypothetical protein
MHAIIVKIFQDDNSPLWWSDFFVIDSQCITLKWSF